MLRHGVGSCVVAGVGSALKVFQTERGHHCCSGHLAGGLMPTAGTRDGPPALVKENAHPLIWPSPAVDPKGEIMLAA